MRVKVGDQVKLTGRTLSPQWRDKLAWVVEVDPKYSNGFTVEVFPCKTQLFVFTNEVKLDSTSAEVESER